MTKHPRHGFLAVIAALVLALPLLSFAYPRQMEALNRGLLVSSLGKSGVLVSWRLLGTEDPNTEFNLYRDGKKIASVGKTDGTNYLDKDGKITSKYTVAKVVGGKEGTKETPSLVLDSNVTYGGRSFPYKMLKVDAPACPPSKGGDTCTYWASDMSVADLDGDGQYELILKWDPSNSKDNSQNGYTSPTLIDAYKVDGTKLWRVNMGWNIRSGAHYTQFQVYDYDGDGKAEMIVKTADGTVDGLGHVIGDSTKDYLDTAGRPMSGPEYLTVFRGIDGAEITTVDYLPARDVRRLGPANDSGTTWGDNYGNRGERYLAATAYLDGVHPSAVFARGYYTAAYVAAYDFDGKDLKLRWLHKSETPGEGLYGQGNHNIFVGDSTPFIRDSRAATSNLSCFAILFFLFYLKPFVALLQSSDDVGFLHDEVVFTVNGDFGAAVLAVENHVADLDFHSDDFALVVLATRAHGHDLTLHRLFLGVIRDKETRGGLLFGFCRLDDDSICKRLNHFHVSFFAGFCALIELFSPSWTIFFVSP